MSKFTYSNDTLDYGTASLQQQITVSVPRLNSGQKLIYNNVVREVKVV